MTVITFVALEAVLPSTLAPWLSMQLLRAWQVRTQLSQCLHLDQVNLREESFRVRALIQQSATIQI
jgi:hypothetical protein